VNPLEQMRDIQLPAPVGWWPPAPGWWLLTVLVLALVAWGLARAVRIASERRQRQRYRGEALQELNNLTCPGRSLYLNELLTLVRRTAISAGLELELTSCSSSILLNKLLMSSDVGKQSSLQAEPLLDNLYRRDPQPLAEPERSLLSRCVADWIRHHAGSPAC